MPISKSETTAVTFTGDTFAHRELFKKYGAIYHKQLKCWILVGDDAKTTGDKISKELTKLEKSPSPVKTIKRYMYETTKFTLDGISSRSRSCEGEILEHKKFKSGKYAGELRMVRTNTGKVFKRTSSVNGLSNWTPYVNGKLDRGGLRHCGAYYFISTEVIKDKSTSWYLGCKEPEWTD